MTVLNLQVGASGDDSSTLLGSFSFNSTEAASFVGNSGGSTCQIWDRWTNVTIPQGTTLTSAIVSLYNVTGSGAGSSINIISKADNVDNHTAPTTGADANGRSLTTGTAWATFGPPSVNTFYTCDIVAEIQTVVNRAGFTSGNAIGVRTIDNTSGGNSNLFVRNYDNDTTKAAKLDITYTAPAVVSAQTAFIALPKRKGIPMLGGRFLISRLAGGGASRSSGNRRRRVIIGGA